MRQVDIKNFEDYQITDDGRVWSKQSNKWLKPFLSDSGYFCVNLYKGGILKQRKLHHLIGEAFIPNPDNKPYIDHINTIRTDNRIENLHWVTQKENCSNPQSVINRIESHKGQIPWIKGKHHTEETLERKSNKVYQYTLDGKLVNVWKSTAECGRNGFSSGNVSQCCNNRYMREGNNIFKGYIWKYNNV